MDSSIWLYLTFVLFYDTEPTAYEITISVHEYIKLVGFNVADSFLLLLHSRKMLLKILRMFSRSTTTHQFTVMKSVVVMSLPLHSITPSVVVLVFLLLLLLLLLHLKRYNQYKVLAYSTTFFQLSLFWFDFFQLRTFMLFIRRWIQTSQDNAHNSQVACNSRVSC